MASPEVLTLTEAFGRSGLSVEQLWFACLGLGSSTTIDDVAEALWAGAAASHRESVILTVALNEALADRGEAGRLPMTAFDPAEDQPDPAEGG